ncbi:hypothetical protein ACIPH4_07680 [Streptomyces tendae]|uniref:hypothetical protein n=1 Tax=Streptomyces tendae TaxID=1932 RepID=UPI00380C9FDB
MAEVLPLVRRLNAAVTCGFSVSCALDVPSGWTGWTVCSPWIEVPDDLAGLGGCLDGILSHWMLR